VKATLRDLVSLKVAFTDLRFTSPRCLRMHIDGGNTIPGMDFPISGVPRTNRRSEALTWVNAAEIG